MVRGMKKHQRSDTRVELADNLDLAVVVDGRRLCARLTPSTARSLAGALVVLANCHRGQGPEHGHSVRLV